MRPTTHIRDKLRELENMSLSEIAERIMDLEGELSVAQGVIENLEAEVELLTHGSV